MSKEGGGNRLLSWTGERCVPWADEPQVIHEHLHRYLFCEDLVAEKRVLDLGSGEGYGSSILASRALSVLGVELDPLAVEHSRRNYNRSNLTFIEGTVLDLAGLDDHSFDVVVCFEVIEHLTDHARLLAEVRRVLSEDGLFVVSTPDRDVYNEELGHVNPYHLKEMDAGEFKDLLASQFSRVEIFGQRAFSGSVMRRVESLHPRQDGSSRVAVRREGDAWEVVKAPPPKYLIGLGSNQTIPDLPGESVLEAASPDSMQSSLRQRHPLAGEALLVGRGLVEALRRRLAIMMRERNRRRQSR